MPNSASARINELGLSLPELAAPIGSYVPYKLLTGSNGPALLYTSGMIPIVAGKPILTGQVGAGVTIEQAQQCARLCALNALAWVRQAIQGEEGFAGMDGIDSIREVVQVRGFVACGPDFAEHPRVLNAASDLLVEIFGDAGRHTRSAVGCSSLPLNVPVEIDFLFAL